MSTPIANAADFEKRDSGLAGEEEVATGDHAHAPQSACSDSLDLPQDGHG